MKELRVLAERWRVHYNTARPHSSLGYRPPAQAAWLTEDALGHGQVQSKLRFPLPHTPDCGGVMLAEAVREITGEQVELAYVDQGHTGDNAATAA